MKYTPTIPTALLLFFLTSPPVFAEGAGIEWEVVRDEASELRAACEYDRAVVLAHKALEIAEKNVGPNHRDVVHSLNSLASLYRVQGRDAAAEPLLHDEPVVGLASDCCVLGPDRVAFVLDWLVLIHD
jgi:hypothetical protein